ncbi:MAG: Bax inhibitor-1/YccA family protein [Clostridia bacterium]|nr:Bax inhibitor-1/YccA family protein [Clostridia bacterium]
MAYRYSNPAINKLSSYGYQSEGARATYSGVAFKSLYFVFITLIAAIACFVLAVNFFSTNPETGIVLLIAVPIIAFICSMVAIFKPSTTPVAGTLYAVFQGLSMGFISLILESAYQGVVFAALISTVTVLLVMSVLYFTGIIRVGAFFKRFMLSALIGVLVTQILMLLLGFIFPSIHLLLYGNSSLSIGISVIMVILASLMILFDLNRITEVVENGMDKRYEWVAAFGLLITLVWLYLEFLRLFSKIASRR